VEQRGDGANVSGSTGAPRTSAPGRRLAGVRAGRVLAGREGSSGPGLSRRARTGVFAPKQHVCPGGELALPGITLREWGLSCCSGPRQSHALLGYALLT